MSAAHAYFKGRSELAVAVLLGLIGIGLAVATVNMTVAGKESIGPQFFPFIVSGLLIAVSVVLSAQVILRRGAPAKTDDIVPTSEFSTDMLEDLSGEHHAAAAKTEVEPRTDWRTVGLITGGLAAFAALLQVLGFVLAAAGLFWVVCFALGSKRPIFDIAIGIIVSSVLQLAFGLGLGLPLPSGFIGVLLGGGA